MDIGLDSLRTASKKVVHKTSKFLGNKIADRGMEHYKISKLLTTKNEYILGFNPTNSSIATPLVSSFIFPMIICSNHHSTLTQSNNY